MGEGNVSNMKCSLSMLSSVSHPPALKYKLGKDLPCRAGEVKREEDSQWDEANKKIGMKKKSSEFYMKAFAFLGKYFPTVLASNSPTFPINWEVV